jgi:putative addiction module component (TIGR02574 family)
MNTTTKEIFIEALSLPIRARATLAEKLLVSLEENETSPEVEKAWTKEAKLRYEAHKKGKIKARSSEDVMREAYRKVK